jgi:RNA polymerase sigma-70 factor (ECF subfamily)
MMPVHLIVPRSAADAARGGSEVGLSVSCGPAGTRPRPNRASNLPESRPIWGRPVSPAGLGAPTSTAFDDWVAAGKTCLRQCCGHRHGDHIPSEDMECNECNCVRFVGFAHPDDSAVWSSLTGIPVGGVHRVIGAESTRGTDDLVAVDATRGASYFPVQLARPVDETAGSLRREPLVGQSDPDGPLTRTTSAELSGRFERDAVPLCAPLYRRAMRMTHNRADAEDLVQDTMMRAFAGFQSFRQGTNLNAWLHRILSNTYIDTYRKKERQPPLYPTGDVTDRQLADNAEHSSQGLRSAEDEALETLPDTEIEAAMQALPERFRTVVYYADVEGLKYTQIAEIMDTPKGTVMSRLHRGRRQLRTLLDNVGTSTRTTRQTTSTS